MLAVNKICCEAVNYNWCQKSFNLYNFHSNYSDYSVMTDKATRALQLGQHPFMILLNIFICV